MADGLRRHDLGFGSEDPEEVRGAASKNNSMKSIAKQSSEASCADPGADPSERSRRQRASVIAGDFIKGEDNNSSAEEVPTENKRTIIAKVQTFSLWFVTNYYVGNIMACVVLVDAVCTWVDIDARAAGLSHPPQFFMLFSDISLALYSTEVLLLLVGKGFIGVLLDWMALLDVTIVLCGYLEVLLNAVAPADVTSSLSVMRALRLARIFRLLRIFKRIRALRELQKLVTMMATCLRTLVWSFLLCFVIMTIWAMLLVEVVHPIIQEMVEDGHEIISNCPYCRTSTSSVMEATLLLFKTVIAGDSWGQVAVPVIQRNPETAVIFVLSQLSLVFGVLNIIVAVVVDTFAEARQNDILNLAEEMEQDIEKDREALGKLFARIDKDGSGQLSLDELIRGARRDPVFQSRLRVMDIDENDLQQLFSMIDVDNNGTIEVGEFIGPLSRWVHDSKTAPRFIKYNMLQTMQLQEDLYSLSKHYFGHLSERIDTLAAHLSILRGGAPSSRQSSVMQSSSLGMARFRQPTENNDEDMKIEQPHCSRKAETLCIGYSSPATSEVTVTTTEAITDSCGDQLGELRQKGAHTDGAVEALIDAAVIKIEFGMIEMEGRLKRALAGIPAEGHAPPARTSNPTASQDMKAFRKDDLFRSVYGDRGIRTSRKMVTASAAQMTFGDGPAAAAAVRRKNSGELGLQHVMTAS
ncbi:Cacna1c [Symbiodinium sp. CCMP2592]|nr:Cacna1c [Symbiodinium sp. CCMP2592]